jgi:hypothetical protein
MIEYLTTNVANGHRFVRDRKQHVRWLIDEQSGESGTAGALAPIQDRREGDRACQEDPPDDLPRGSRDGVRPSEEMGDQEPRLPETVGDGQDGQVRPADVV